MTMFLHAIFNFALCQSPSVKLSRQTCNPLTQSYRFAIYAITPNAMTFVNKPNNKRSFTLPVFLEHFYYDDWNCGFTNRSQNPCLIILLHVDRPNAEICKQIKFYLMIMATRLQWNQPFPFTSLAFYNSIGKHEYLNIN